MGKTVMQSVRIPADLLERVDQRVASRGVSRNSWIIKAITDALRSHKKGKDRTSEIIAQLRRLNEQQTDKPVDKQP